MVQTQRGSYVTTLPKPDVKWGLPSEVLLSPDNRYLLVAYDYSPTWLDLFEVDGFKKIRTYRIRNHIYLSTSYFSGDGTKMFINVGQRIRIFLEKPKFYVYTVGEKDRKIVKCRNSPKGCSYPLNNETGLVEDTETGMFYSEYVPVQGKYKYRIINNEVEVYTKK